LFKKDSMQNKTKKKIFTYLTFLIAFSGIFYALILRAGTLAAEGGLFVLGLMWVPGFSAILTQLIFEHSLRGLGWKPGRFKYLLIGYFLPIVYGLVVYGITWTSGLGTFDQATLIANTSGFFTDLPQFWRSAIYFVYLGVLGVFSGLISGMGEEIGWRGLLFPELNKLFSFNRATLITGAIWTVWHLPLILFADYITPGIPRWYGAVMFTLMVTGLNFAFSWLRKSSGSFWPAAVLHASHNLFIQTIFTPLTLQNSVTPYIIDEFGAGLALAGLVLALVFWQRRNDSRPTAA
jgi:membrane protease YdiL (CAAX protease family)